MGTALLQHARACGTGGRDDERGVALTVLLEDLLDRRDHIPPLHDGDAVAYGEFELVDVLLVVERRTSDGGAAQSDRLQLRHRGYASGAPDLDGDAKDLRDGLRGLELVCDRPAGMMFRVAEGFAHVELVDLGDHAVYLVFEGAPPERDLLQVRRQIAELQGPRLDAGLGKKPFGLLTR